MSVRLPVLAAALLAPAAALAQARPPLTPPQVFMDAALFPRAIMLGLIVASVAAVAVAAIRLAGRRAGGSTFLSSLRYGGPLAGLLGSAYCLFAMSLGVANWPTVPTLTQLAPGVAEAVLLFGLGMLAGCVAVVAHALLEGRAARAA